VSLHCLLFVIKILLFFSEIQYNEDGKGCIVDLLSTNETNDNRIKLTAVVRNKRGGIKNCLVPGKKVKDSSYNNK